MENLQQKDLDQHVSPHYPQNLVRKMVYNNSKLTNMFLNNTFSLGKVNMLIEKFPKVGRLCTQLESLVQQIQEEIKTISLLYGRKENKFLIARNGK